MARHVSFPNLGVQVFDLLFINPRCFAVTALKNARRRFQQRTFPTVDHLGMHPKPTGQLTDSFFAFQRFQRDLRFEFSMMLLSLRHS